jgi:hypothetical protein
MMSASDSYPPAQTTIENVPLTFSTQNSNALSAATTANYVGLQVHSGTLTLATTSGISFINGTQNGSNTIDFQGTASAMNAALNGLVFTPSKNFAGSDPLTFTTGAPFLLLFEAYTTNTIPMTVSPAPPTVVTPATANPNPVPGASTALSVLGADDAGESSLTYTWTTTGTPPASVVFSVNGTNAAKNTAAEFTKAGTYNFLVTIKDGNGLSTTSAVSVLVSQTLSSILVSPSTSNLNENQNQSFSAVGYDQFGNPMSVQPVFTWSNTGIGSINAGSGAYSSPGASGNAMVIATSGSLSGSASITVTNAPPTVATAASATPNPLTGASTALNVLGADDGGEANLTYSWSALSKPAGAAAPSFSLNGSNAAQNTVATFSKAGNYVLEATITDAGGLSTTSSVSVTVQQTFTSIAVSPANTSLGAGRTQQFSAVALDQFGQNMAPQPSFTWTSSSGVVTSAGLFTAPPTAGGVTVHATSGSVSGSASVTVVGNNTAVASPSTVTAATTTLSVVGGATSGVTYTWSVLTKPTGASTPTFSVNGSGTAQTTMAIFFAAGNYTFQVSINSGTVTTQTVAVTVEQTLSNILVSPGTATLNENGQQHFSAAGVDQFGKSMATAPVFSWLVSSGGGTIGNTGLYTAPGSGHAGTATISARSGSVVGSANVTVTNAAPTVASPAAAFPSPVIGTSTLLSVMGADDGGESNLTYRWSTSGAVPAAVTFSANNTNAAKNTIATFSKAGAYTFLVTITDAEGLSKTSSVSVTVAQTVTHVVVSPTSPTVVENTQQQFTATATDQFGNPIAAPAFTWSVLSGGGSISSSGLYTAPATFGTTSIYVSAQGVGATATVTIPNEPPTIAIAAAASPNPVYATSTDLSVLGADDGGEPNLTYSWSTVGTPPAQVIFSVNNTNAAKNATAVFSAPGTYDFLVTITDAQGAFTTSSVSVTVAPTFSSIQISPGAASIERAGTAQFSAVGRDQFGGVLANQPAFTWSVIGGAGSINSSGIYSAPDAPSGTATVIASSGNVSGTAIISLIDDLSAKVPPTQTTLTDVALIFADGNAITVSDGDPNTTAVPASLTLTATNGTVSLASTTGLTLSAGSGTGDTSVTFTGQISDLDNALNGAMFVSKPGFLGPASLSMTVNEVGNSTAPTYTIPINVNAPAAVTTTTPPQAIATSPSGNGTSSGGNPNGVLETNPSSSGGPINGPITPNTFSDVNIDSNTSTGNSAPASNSAAQAPSASGNTASGALNTDGGPAGEKQLAAVNPALSKLDDVPDSRVETVPDQIFPFLSKQSEMSKELDQVKEEIASQTEMKIAAGSATVVSFSASAAYFIWLLRGGSLLSSILSVIPAWKSIDPLPVLDNFESRKRRKARIASDLESLESLVDKSNNAAPNPASRGASRKAS